MKPVIIKRSAAIFLQAPVFGLLVSVLALLFFFHEVTTFGYSPHLWVAAFFIMLFLVPSVAGVIAARKRANAAITLSDDGITFSAPDDNYGIVKLLKKIPIPPPVLVPWEHIAAFDLFTHYERRSINCSDSSGSTTYSKRLDSLHIIDQANQKDLYFAITDLEKTPEEILDLCRQFQMTFKR